MPKAQDSQFITIRGKTSFARILGDPMDNYDRDGKEWKMDLELMNEAEDRARLKELGVADRIRQKEDYLDGAPFLTLRQKTRKVRNEETGQMEWENPPRVRNIQGKKWDPEELVGNGSVVDVKLRVADYGKGFKKGMYINAIRVLELVPYNRPLFDELDENDPYYQKGAVKQPEREPDFDDDDLDDDIAF